MINITIIKIKPKKYLKRLYEYQYDEDYLGGVFKSYLESTGNMKGLLTRIERRYKQSKEVEIAQIEPKLEGCNLS